MEKITINPDFIITLKKGTLNIQQNNIRCNINYSLTENNKPYISSTQNFIYPIEQGHQTLFKIIEAVVYFQYDFFTTKTGEKILKPMILKDIATLTGIHSGTISRYVHGIRIQTDFGMYYLKDLFSNGIPTETGQDISSIEIKKILQKWITKEKLPLSDAALTIMLKNSGYIIARRTVAKYREQLNLPSKCNRQ